MFVPISLLRHPKVIGARRHFSSSLDFLQGFGVVFGIFLWLLV
jgi:hypothetical protein